ncbi:MAG: hypothetical protein J6K14_07950 [Clostridia bacterium]|nr:hypothetical protein [Clostridia bacterium]
MTEKRFTFKKFFAWICTIAVVVLYLIGLGDATYTRSCYCGMDRFYVDLGAFGQVVIGDFLILSLPFVLGLAYLVYRLLTARAGIVRVLLSLLLTLGAYVVLDLIDWTTPHILEFGLALLLILLFYFLLGRLFGVSKKSEKAEVAEPVYTEAPAPAASPKYEEQTVTVKGAKSVKAMSKELAPYVKSGWKIERVYDIDRKSRSVQMKRMK